MSFTRYVVLPSGRDEDPYELVFDHSPGASTPHDRFHYIFTMKVNYQQVPESRPAKEFIINRTNRLPVVEQSEPKVFSKEHKIKVEVPFKPYMTIEDAQSETPASKKKQWTELLWQYARMFLETYNVDAEKKCGRKTKIWCASNGMYECDKNENLTYSNGIQSGLPVWGDLVIEIKTKKDYQWFGACAGYSKCLLERRNTPLL